MNRPALSEALKSADRLIDNATLIEAIARMGAQINRACAGQEVVFLTIMNGALVFGGHLATTLTVDCEFDYLHATRYRGETSGGQLHWIKKPNLDLKGRHVLIVDDILDEGHTLAAVRDFCATQGAASVRIAVLALKVHDRCVPGLKADFVGVEVPDRYVFGFGMDYHEQGRNLPAIYAV